MPMVIAFDKVTYSPGGLVSGHVVVIKKGPEKVKGLSLRFYGKACKFLSDLAANENLTNAKGNNKRETTYFDEKIDIFGHDGSDTVLKVGETLFPFSFSLPLGLPSSFVWGRGSVQYFVEARLTRSSWKDDKKCLSRLNVEGTYDLNIDPLALLPVSIQRSKYVQHLLTKSGPLGFTFSLTRSGFLRGHNLPFHIEVRNYSKIDTKKVRVSLIQDVAQEDGKKWTNTVSEVKGPCILSGEVQGYEARIKIPMEIPPTNLGNVLNFPPLLRLSYSLKVDVFLKKTAPIIQTDPYITVKVPITIGTLPLLRPRSRSRSRSGAMRDYHQHEETCPMSMSQGHSLHQGPSEFSPGFLSNPECRNCRQHGQIYRRLRNLQRRRRESPPPTYDEVIGVENSNSPTSNGQNQPEDNHNQQDSSIRPESSLSMMMKKLDNLVDNQELPLPPSENIAGKNSEHETDQTDNVIPSTSHTPITSSTTIVSISNEE